MQKMNSTALLEQLQEATRQLMLQTHHLLQQDPEILLKQPVPGKWSVAQNIEHLNTYGRYYLPVIHKKLQQSTYPFNPVFVPGWVGNYFTRMMRPDEKGMVRNKMKALKNHRPPPDIDSKNVLEVFLEQQQQLLELLKESHHTDIGRVRIPISISRFFTLKAGDTFRFYIAHQQRHFVQIANTLDMISHNKETLNNRVA